MCLKARCGGEGHGHNVLANGFSNSGRLHKKSLITAVPSKKGTREWVRMERRQFTGFSFFTLNFFFTMYIFYFLKQCKAYKKEDKNIKELIIHQSVPLITTEVYIHSSAHKKAVEYIA